MLAAPEVPSADQPQASPRCVGDVQPALEAQHDIGTAVDGQPISPQRHQAVFEQLVEEDGSIRSVANARISRDLAEVEQGLDLIISPLVSQEEQKVAKQERAKAKAKVAAKA